MPPFKISLLAAPQLPPRCIRAYYINGSLAAARGDLLKWGEFLTPLRVFLFTPDKKGFCPRISICAKQTPIFRVKLNPMEQHYAACCTVYLQEYTFARFSDILRENYLRGRPLEATSRFIAYQALSLYNIRFQIAIVFKNF